MHVSYLHMWDETQVRSQARRSNKYRRIGLGISAQTMSQRGVIGFRMINTISGGYATFDEAWLCRPWQVVGTSAPALVPAILENMPAFLQECSMHSLKALAGMASSFTFLPISDKASGNINILRFFAHKVQQLREQHGVTNILILPDVCGVHQHHRGKLSPKLVRWHTMRHFSSANLYRLEPIQARMIRHVEELVALKMCRKVGPP